MEQEKSLLDNLVDQSWTLRDLKPDESRELAEKAYQLAKEQDYSIGIAHSTFMLAFLDYRSSLYSDALTKVEQAQQLLASLDAPAWLPRVYNLLGILYRTLGNHSLALDYHQRQLALCHQLGDKKMEATAYYNLGLLQLDNVPDTVLEHFEHALKLEQELQDVDAEVVTLTAMSTVYTNVYQNYAQAEKLLEEAYVKACSISKNLSIVYILLMRGKVNLEKKNTQLALEYAREAQIIAETCSKTEVAQACLLLSEIYYQTGNLNEALSYCQKGLEIAEALNMVIALPPLHEQLANIYEDLQDYEKGLYHFKKYFDYKSEFAKGESEQKIRALEVINRTELMKREAIMEREKNIQLQHYVTELERLNNEIQNLSLRDSLTGAFNRRYLAETGERLLQQALRYGRPFSVAMVDADHFKAINDRFGHSIGDEVLKTLTALLKANLREVDVIVRYGGEEFTLLLPETPLVNAEVACERLRQQIQSFNWTNLNSSLSVTVSIGVCSSLENSTLETLLKSADQLLYEAKKMGRNCVRTNTNV